MALAMILLTDNTAFAQRCIPQSGDWQPCEVSALPLAEATLAAELFKSSSIMKTELNTGGYWRYLYAIDCAEKSQYDVLARLAVSASSSMNLQERTARAFRLINTCEHHL